jgi:hypothetical protein
VRRRGRRRADAPRHGPCCRTHQPRRPTREQPRPLRSRPGRRAAVARMHVGESTSAAAPPLVGVGVTKQACARQHIRSRKPASECWSETRLSPKAGRPRRPAGPRRYLCSVHRLARRAVGSRAAAVALGTARMRQSARPTLRSAPAPAMPTHRRGSDGPRGAAASRQKLNTSAHWGAFPLRPDRLLEGCKHGWEAAVVSVTERGGRKLWSCTAWTVTSAPPECCIAVADVQPWPCRSAWLVAFQRSSVG